MIGRLGLLITVLRIVFATEDLQRGRHVGNAGPDKQTKELLAETQALNSKITSDSSAIDINSHGLIKPF